MVEHVLLAVSAVVVDGVKQVSECKFWLFKHLWELLIKLPLYWGDSFVSLDERSDYNKDIVIKGNGFGVSHVEVDGTEFLLKKIWKRWDVFLLLDDHPYNVHAFADTHDALIRHFFTLLLLVKHAGYRGFKNYQYLLVQDSSEKFAEFENKLEKLGVVDGRHEVGNHLNYLGQEGQKPFRNIWVNGNGLEGVYALQSNNFLWALHHADTLKKETCGFLESFKVLNK